MKTSKHLLFAMGLGLFLLTYVSTYYGFQIFVPTLIVSVVIGSYLSYLFYKKR
jgi:hypothetical protein